MVEEPWQKLKQMCVMSCAAYASPLRGIVYILFISTYRFNGQEKSLKNYILPDRHCTNSIFIVFSVPVLSAVVFEFYNVVQHTCLSQTGLIITLPEQGTALLGPRIVIFLSSSAST